MKAHSSTNQKACTIWIIQMFHLYKLKRPENDFFGLITEIKWFDLNIWKKPFVIEEEVIYSLNLLINARILRIVAKILLNFISVL